MGIELNGKRRSAGRVALDVGRARMAHLAAGLAPGILLSDIVMPGNVHGVELARQIRTRLPAVRDVLVTGYSDVAEQASQEGYAVIRKPYDLSKLMAAIAR